jgi:hypothetical protein
MVVAAASMVAIPLKINFIPWLLAPTERAASHRISLPVEE